MLDEITDFLRGKDGSIASAKCTEQNMRRSGKGHMYEWLMEETKELPESFTLFLRYTAVLNGIKKLARCVVCGIGFSRFVRVDKGQKYVKTCSTLCSHKDPARRAKLSATKLATDPTESNAKRAKTMLEKYGHSYNGQRPEVKERHMIRMTEKYMALNPTAFALINDENWLREEYVNKRRCSVDIAAEVGVDYDTVLTRCRRFGFDIRHRVNRSYLEIQVEDYVKSLGFDTKSSDRSILSGNKEVDIFVPAANLAIEFNGLYWHSAASQELESETRKRHIDKTEECLSKGINMIQIFEWEWREKQDIVKAIISSRLGKVDKIYARQCEFVEISVDKEKEFMDNNHIQGYKKSDSRIALAHQGEVVFVMSFCKSRFTDKYDTEILRMCGKKNTSIIGAAGKIISKFEETFKGKLLSYANRRFGEGNVYKNCGFERKENSSLGYWWVKSNRKISRHTVNTEAARQTFLKEDFLPGETENQAMYRCGFRKIFDCGNAVWVKEIK